MGSWQRLWLSPVVVGLTGEGLARAAKGRRCAISTPVWRAGWDSCGRAEMAAGGETMPKGVSFGAEAEQLQTRRPSSKVAHSLGPGPS